MALAVHLTLKFNPNFYTYRNIFNINKNFMSTHNINATKTKSKYIYIIGFCGSGILAIVGALEYSVNAMTSLHLHPPKYPWSHNGIGQSLDMSSVRRGYFVYKNVCAACHNLKFKSYRELTDFMTIDEAKAEAAEIQVKDGPDEVGNMFDRPGRLTDLFQNPYPNENAARAANNGALPPDLSLIVRARDNYEDYIFSILTGYEEPPGGVAIAETQHYNPYFPGGAIAMAQALYDDIIEYEDGTPATLSQLAKDVTTFLRWTSDPKFNERKKRALKVLMFAPFVFGATYYMYRSKAVLFKSTKFIFKPPTKDKIL